MELFGTESIHDSIKDTELTGREGTNHDATRDQSYRAELDKANLLGNGHETCQHGSITTGAIRALAMRSASAWFAE